jgi:hypothetical protein
LLAGIALAETSLGKAGRGPSIHNAWGWMTSAGPPNQMSFPSWPAAIRHVGNTLGKRGWRDPAQFARSYVGGDASTWLRNVRSVMNRFGGGVPAAPAGGGGARGGRGARGIGADVDDRRQMILSMLLLRRTVGGSESMRLMIPMIQSLMSPKTPTERVKNGVEFGRGAGRAAGSKTVQRAISIAKDFLGTPYVWGSAGGRSDFGPRPQAFDCSGFIAYVWFRATNGRVKLPAYTGDLVKRGRPVKLGQLQPGDALFFDTNQKYGHVGMYLGNGKFIHASSTGSVKISTLKGYPYKPSAIRRYDV